MTLAPMVSLWRSQKGSLDMSGNLSVLAFRSNSWRHLHVGVRSKPTSLLLPFPLEWCQALLLPCSFGGVGPRSCFFSGALNLHPPSPISPPTLTLTLNALLVPPSLLAGPPLSPPSPVSVPCILALERHTSIEVFQWLEGHTGHPACPELQTFFVYF